MPFFLAKKDPATTSVEDVMTKAVKTILVSTDRKTAKKLMIDNHIRHLPVVDETGKVVSMLSMRHLLRADISDLEETIWTLVSEASMDARGG